MKSKQIQGYISVEDYNSLKSIADSQGLLFATLLRQIIKNYLNPNKQC